MNDSATNLKDILLEQEVTGENEAWSTFERAVEQEISESEFDASLPDLAEKVAAMLDIELPDLLVAAWKKQVQVADILEQSHASPEETFYVELVEHTVESEHQPTIELSVREVVVKKMEFLLSLVLTLRGIILEIKAGTIREIQTGECTFEGRLNYRDLTLLQRASSPLHLPGNIQIE